jgi:glycosyltransferase involved in cell wall biosynthesis
LIATVLNEAGSLPALLDSIDEQTRPPDEVVVVDGGSTDGTLDILATWAEQRPGTTVLSAPGVNIARGRNLAIAAARGAVIAATDAGVVLTPRWLEALVHTLEASPAADVAAGFFAAAPHSAFERALGATTLPNVDEIDPCRFLPSSRSVAFRRAVWSAVGGYPEWLDYCEDLVFDFALRRAGFRFTWVPEALVRFRPRPTLGTFFTQYLRYARGDGKADLWRGRHAVRYGTYLVGVPLIWRARRHPLGVAVALGAGALYVRRPVQRLLRSRAQTADCASGGTSTYAPLFAELALIPLIRLVGDVAKMLGYPAGVAWRLRSHRAGAV